MHTSAFPNCCGAFILQGFPCAGGKNYNWEDKKGSTSYNEVLTYVQDYIKTYTRAGFGVIILNSSQTRNGVDKPILEAGFELVTDGAYHPGHGRDLYMYVYYHQKDERKPVKAVKPVEKVATYAAASSSSSEVKTEKAKPGPKKRLFTRSGIFSAVTEMKPIRRRIRRVKP